MVAIESAGITDIGRKRKNNEDALFFDDDLGLYIVADGMGGHLAGEVASRLVVETIRDYMGRFKEDEDAEELQVGADRAAQRLTLFVDQHDVVRGRALGPVLAAHRAIRRKAATT